MKSIAIYYLKLLDKIREVGRAHGYAIALHGSVERDLDVIAVPWTDEATGRVEFAEAVRVAVGGHYSAVESNKEYCRLGSPGAKPHHRRTWVFQLGGGAYVDLSIMPKTGGETFGLEPGLRECGDGDVPEQVYACLPSPIVQSPGPPDPK